MAIADFTPKELGAKYLQGKQQQNPQCNDCVYDDSQERVKGKR
jgi:hypothetical protein